jgi:hypothetical protein
MKEMTEIILMEDGKELARFKVKRKAFDKCWKLAFDNQEG